MILGMMFIMSDMGLRIRGNVWADSTTAKSIASRRGLGKVRHIQTTYLWIQERVASKDFDLFKVKGEENVADLVTKHLDKVTAERFSDQLGVRSMTGRSDQQLQVASN